MNFDRSEAVTYLVGEYGSGANNLLAQAKIAATDTNGGLKNPIDRAISLVGGSWSEWATFEADDVPQFMTALRYTTLTRILAGLNAKTNMDVGAGSGVTLRGSQLVEKVERMLLIAAKECKLENLNVVLPGSESGWPIDSEGFLLGVNLDFLEDVEVGAE